MLRRRTVPKNRDHTLREACAIEMHLDISQEPFCHGFTGHATDQDWGDQICR